VSSFDPSEAFGLTHHIVDQARHSHLIATVIGSPVVPTLVAETFFVPRYLLPKAPARSSIGSLPGTVAIGEGEHP
jgi:hypothetical protein